MSHFSKDIIADNAIDHVANMPISQVASLLKANSFYFHPSENEDSMRDAAIDIVFQELMERPGQAG